MSDLNALVFAEHYRPKTVDECILPENTKRMIKDSIASGNIPHFVFAGTAGIGKCLDPLEEVDLMVSDRIFETLNTILKTSGNGHGNFQGRQK